MNKEREREIEWKRERERVKNIRWYERDQKNL